MANVRNRTRVIYFRVSEDEFLQFRELCQHRGARNMSDLVRSAIQLMVRDGGSSFEVEVAERLRQLEHSVATLSRSMEQFTMERQA